MRELGPEVLGPFLTVLVVLSHMVVGSVVGLMIAAALATVRHLGLSSWMDRRREQTKLVLGFILGFMPFLANATGGYDPSALSLGAAGCTLMQRERDWVQVVFMHAISYRLA